MTLLVEKVKQWFFELDVETLLAAGWGIEQLKGTSRETVLHILQHGISPAYAVYLVNPGGSTYSWIGNVTTVITENATVDLADNIIHKLWNELPHGQDVRLVLKDMRAAHAESYPIPPIPEHCNDTFTVSLSANHPLWQELWESAHPVEALAEAHGRFAENKRTL